MTETDIIRLIPKIGYQISFRKCLNEFLKNKTHHELPKMMQQQAQLQFKAPQQPQPIFMLPTPNIKKRKLSSEISPKPKIFQTNNAPTNILSKENSTDNVVLEWNRQFAKDLDLKKILHSNLYGNLVLSYAENILPSKMKNQLSKIIIDEFINNGVNMGTKEFQIVAEKIKEYFPLEDPLEYYVAGKDGIKSRGKIPDRFYNVKRELKKHKFLSKE